MADCTELLLHYGLTRPEAKLYILLLTEGQLSGYEAAKKSGISRSNVYSALSGLVEKGAALVAEEQAVQYQAVPFEEFSADYVANLQKIGKELVSLLPQRRNPTDNYITIRGTQHVHNKFRHMLEQTRHRIYLSGSEDIVLYFAREIEQLLDQEKKVVLLTQDTEAIRTRLGRATIFDRIAEDEVFRLITDSSFCLMGNMSGDKETNCLFTSNPNLVRLMKDALSNEIKLIEIENKSGKETV